MLRFLAALALLCLAATPASACVFDTECPRGSVCVDGNCNGGSVQPEEPDLSIPPNPAGGRSCTYDSDCREGARCIKGSGLHGVCLGR